MAWTSAYSAALGTGTTSVTVNAPAGAATGDILVAFIVDKATSGTTGTVAPTGWTFVVAAAGTGGRIQCFIATVGLNSLTGTSWSWAGLTTTSSGAIAGYTGGYGPSPLNGTQTGRINASGTTGTTAITTTTNGGIVIAAFCSLSNGATWSGETLASGPVITEGFDNNNSTLQSLAIADGAQVTAGATGVSSATMSVATANGGILLALNPDIVGVDITNLSGGAVLGFPLGVDVSSLSAGAVLGFPLGVNISNWSAAAVLAYNNANPPVWNFTTMPNGVLGNPYTFSWNLAPAAPPVTYSVLSGSLPTGLSLSSGPLAVGTISGTPTVIGVFSFTLRATNTYGMADQPFTITITTPVLGQGGNWGFTA